MLRWLSQQCNRVYFIHSNNGRPFTQFTLTTIQERIVYMALVISI